MLHLTAPLSIFLLNAALGVVLSNRIFKRSRKDLLPLLAMVAAILIIGWLLRYPTYELLVTSAFATLAFLLSIRYTYSLLGFALLLFLIALESSMLALLSIPALYMFILGFAIGTIFGLIYVERLTAHQNIRGASSIEVKRDVVQILIGIVTLLAILLYGARGTVTIALLGIASYAAISIISTRRSTLIARKGNRAAKLQGAFAVLLGLERKGTIYGLGAVYMMAGYMLLAGLIVSGSFMLFGVAALMICDAAATITGRMLKHKHRLPYNSSKSVEGSLAFFSIALAFGYLFFVNALIAVLFSALLALLESIRLPIDDNITIPGAIVVLYALSTFIL
ncbi:MAG: hypothetical protein QXK65_03325 [Candidatus Micrarchaeaceae archaeon]